MLAIAIAISPFPIIGVVLVLGSRGAHANAAAFLAGWLGGMLAAGGFALLLLGGSDASADAEPAAWLAAVMLVGGVIVIAAGLKQWRDRPRRGEEVPVPGWMERAERFAPREAAALGVVLAAVNPKNLLLVVAAAASIGATGAAADAQLAALLAFTAIATIGCGTPIALFYALGERSERTVAGLRAWMEAHSSVILTVILLVIGAKLIGDALSGLT